MTEIEPWKYEAANHGLLPHEHEFITHALYAAMQKQKAADGAYREAVGNSGGDWAFDDPASAATALEAHVSDQVVAIYKQAKTAHEKNGAEEYPATDLDTVACGSRVTVDYGCDDTEVVDIATRNIPNMPDLEGSEFISADSAMGLALLGARAREVIKWTLSNGKTIEATVLHINQEAVAGAYETVPDDAS